MSKFEPDWQWLTDLLTQFNVTNKITMAKDAGDCTGLEAQLYTEIQRRYTPRTKPNYIETPTGGRTSAEYEQAKRIHADQIATMEKMGYGLMLDGFTFYKYGYELAPFNYETNFTMHQAYEIHKLVATREQGKGKTE